MQANASIEIFPEYKEMLELHDDLKEELTKLYADKEDLLNTVKLNLELDYQLKIGGKQYELMMVKIEALRLKRKSEILLSAINRQVKCSIDVIEAQLDFEFEKWNKEAIEFYKDLKFAEAYTGLEKMTSEDVLGMKKIYRELAKKFHPDLNPDWQEEARNFWQRIVEAYGNNDLKELKILELLSRDFEKEERVLSTMELLKKDCESLKEKIKEMINDIAHIKKGFPFDIEDKLLDDEWVKEQNRLIEEQIDKWQESKRIFEAKVEELTIIIEKPKFINER
jgi:gas vesicle protein